jgi:hypothetical protein
MDFLNWLTQITNSLREVNDWGALDQWHTDFAQSWEHQRIHIDSINQILGLTGDFQLRADTGYIAVRMGDEHANYTTVLVSVNPGWSDSWHRQESELMGVADQLDVGRYNAFRNAFLPQFQDVMSQYSRGIASWWNHALIFAHDIHDIERPADGGMCRFSPELQLIGWELWPFRSRRDGLTAAAQQVPELMAFARASLEAAARVTGKPLLICSKAGYDLVRRMMPDTARKNLDQIPVCRAMVGEQNVTAIGRQLFSGFGVVSVARRNMLADWVAERPVQAIHGQPQAHIHGGNMAVQNGDDLIQFQRLADAGANYNGPICVFVSVSGVKTANGQLGPLIVDNTVDELDVHQRVGGYWTLRVNGNGGQKAQKIQSTLNNGHTVFLVAKHQMRVVRVLKVSCAPLFAPQNVEIDRLGSEFHLVAAEAFPVLQCQHQDGHWARVYEEWPAGAQAAVAHKVRYMLETIDDTAWIGRWCEGVPPQPTGLFAPPQEFG